VILLVQEEAVVSGGSFMKEDTEWWWLLETAGEYKNLCENKKLNKIYKCRRDFPGKDEDYICFRINSG
jgi:hypothetical protein